MTVTVEFYGLPRHHAGRAAMVVEATTVRAMLEAVGRACPALKDLVREGRLVPYYVVSLDGEEFVTNVDRTLQPGARVLLLSADAGG
jgi:molybdopterin converting factor small subunit